MFFILQNHSSTLCLCKSSLSSSPTYCPKSSWLTTRKHQTFKCYCKTRPTHSTQWNTHQNYSTAHAPLQLQVVTSEKKQLLSTTNEGVDPEDCWHSRPPKSLAYSPRSLGNSGSSRTLNVSPVMMIAWWGVGSNRNIEKVIHLNRRIVGSRLASFTSNLKNTPHLKNEKMSCKAENFVVLIDVFL